MGYFVFWLVLMALAALIVVPKIKEWKEQGSSVDVPYREMWRKRVFRYRLQISVEEAMNRLQDHLSCAGVAYTFDPTQLQITLRSDIPDGTVPATFQLTFEHDMMIVTRLTRTSNAGPIQLAMGVFWQKKLNAEFVNCE